MARLGCLLIILSFAALCGIVVLPVLPFLNDTAVIDDMLAPLICQSGERIQRDQYSTTNRGGVSFSMSVYCLDQDGRQRDVTDRWTLLGLGTFALPFLLGLVMFIGGVARRVKKTVTIPPDS